MSRKPQPVAPISEFRYFHGGAARVLIGNPCLWLPTWVAQVNHMPDSDVWAAFDPKGMADLIDDEGWWAGWVSDEHQVVVRRLEAPEPDAPPLYHLSFKKRSRNPIGDWRLKQRIKNAIFGDESEGIELYPAESRLMDTSNQYHLYVLLPPFRFPIGYQERAVVDGTGKEPVGVSRQRPLRDQGGKL